MAAVAVPPNPTTRAPFHTTRWSLVSRAQRDDTEGTSALEELCALYWPPVYAFYRRQGQTVDDAQDLTQGLFTDLLERGDLRGADPARGRFRAFLCACARNYLANACDRARADKRGGGRKLLSLDTGREELELAREPAVHLDAEALFERRWACAVIDKALARLELEEIRAGRGRMFGVLLPTLSGEDLGRPYALVATELGTSEGALKVIVHRLRRRFRERLLAEVGHTITDPADAADEISTLLAALAR